MVNLTGCTWRGEPRHRRIQSSNGIMNTSIRLFSIQYYVKKKKLLINNYNLIGFIKID